ncbi:MAG: ATP-binding cassette domain-containing protein [Candidatus Margulisbacteria bacterium]|nr:ATP-binding cassette domain-containing protein [Candidatus Margulisiibacteriota bacterium]
MIHCEALCKTYTLGDQTFYALDHVNLDIQEGEFVAIMGPSGSGKSTLMNVLGLLDSPTSGTYLLDGTSTSYLDETALAHLRARRIGFIFQQFNLLKRTSALENVALPLLYTGSRNTEFPATLLQKVGLGERMLHKPNELSGGQQQRVAIARALVNEPRIIFADEPTGNLDSQSQADIMDLLTALNREGITIVLVTHEEEIAQLTRRVIRMRDGKILSDSNTSETHQNSSPASPITPIHTSFLRTFLTHTKQAFRSLRANKLQSFLSVLGILIGVAAVIAMLALGKGAQKSIEDRLASLGSNLLQLRQGNAQSRGIGLESGAVSRITILDAKAVGTLPFVRRVGASVNGRAQVEFGSLNKNTQLIGAQEAYAEMRAAKPVLGRFFTTGEDMGRAKVVLIGVTVLKNLFGENPDGSYKNPVGEFIKVNRIRFQVIGVLPEKGGSAYRDEDDVIVIPLNTAMKRVLGKEYLNSVDIEVSDATHLLSVQDAALSLMRVRHHLPPSKEDAYEIRNLADIQDTLSSTSKTMSVLLAIIAGISLLVGGIGIMNIMLVSVTERTREIGLRKAIGARPVDILWQFLIESVVISVMGGLIGIGLGCGITMALGQVAGWAVVLSQTSIVIAFTFSAAIGIGFGLWPAKKAAALNPIDALRYE